MTHKIANGELGQCTICPCGCKRAIFLLVSAHFTHHYYYYYHAQGEAEALLCTKNLVLPQLWQEVCQ